MSLKTGQNNKPHGNIALILRRYLFYCAVVFASAVVLGYAAIRAAATSDVANEQDERGGQTSAATAIETTVTAGGLVFSVIVVAVPWQYSKLRYYRKLETLGLIEPLFEFATAAAAGSRESEGPGTSPVPDTEVEKEVGEVEYL